MKVLGISPLDKDATAALVEDGRVLWAAGEERFSRNKLHSGFPTEAILGALQGTGTRPEDLDAIAYPFMTAEQEAGCMRRAFEADAGVRRAPGPALGALLSAAEQRVVLRREPIDGLTRPDQRFRKGWLKEQFHRLAACQRLVASAMSGHLERRWLRRAIAEHRHWQLELERGLARLGLGARLIRSEHHQSHAANAFLASGFERALVVTLDGYGSGLSGSISIGENGTLRRLHGLRFPHSLGAFYESVTSSLGFSPDRHAGKIVGLAAFGEPEVLLSVLRTRCRVVEGDLELFENLNVHFSRHLAARFAMIDVAAAWQRMLELLAREIVAHWLAVTAADHLVLSGGVAANVKMNQRLRELEGVRGVFVYPNMGDGGCGTGLALLHTWPGGVGEPLHDVYFGPEFGEAEILGALRAAGLSFERPADLARHVAERIHAGAVVARFAGRMEYGPRALGNRSILYHGREPKVNQWLNRRLARTEFMPFAPVTKSEAADRCYHGVEGARHTAEFMTLTFDCTDWMKAHCPAAVHVDGTARPQLVRREVNPEYWRILDEYERLSGIPCLINTSFNMHEEPIVCSPSDAIRAFLDGRIEALAIGPFFVEHPSAARTDPAERLG